MFKFQLHAVCTNFKQVYKSTLYIGYTDILEITAVKVASTA